MDVSINYMIRRATFEGWQIHTRCIQDYELVYIIRGCGKIRIDDRQISVSSGDLICFRPNVPHSLWLEQEPYMEFYGLHFQISEEKLLDKVPDYTHLESGPWLEIQMRNLYEEYRKKRYLSGWKQEILLQQILCEILIKQHAEQEPISHSRISKVLAYIHENPFREYSMAELVQQAGVKKSLLLKNFRSVTGTTPLRYITDLRLEQARDLLTETDLQISQISEQCGFADPFYFSRCFKKRFSISPTRYRENNR